MQWRPAPLRTQATVFFQPAQEGMGDEWVAAIVQRIPLRGADVGERSVRAEFWHDARLTDDSVHVSFYLRKRVPQADEGEPE